MKSLLIYMLRSIAKYYEFVNCILLIVNCYVNKLFNKVRLRLSYLILG